MQSTECEKTDQCKEERTAGQRKPASHIAVSSLSWTPKSVSAQENVLLTATWWLVRDTHLPAEFLQPLLMGVEGRVRSQMGPESVLCKKTAPDGPEGLVSGHIRKRTFAIFWLGITSNCISTWPPKTHFSL